MEMETKQVKAVELKMVDEGDGEIAGYASTYDWDSVKERVVPGAFTPHLSDFLSSGFVAAGHDWAEPIGVPLEAYEDERGLYVRAALHSTPRAQAFRSIIKERMAHQKAVKLSIGYEVLKDEYTQEGRLLKEIKLWEWSYVAVPANQNAVLLASKGQAVSALPLDVHSATVVSAIEELQARFKANNEIRVKEGRVLSDANRKRIGTLLESLTSIQQELTDLLASTEPKASADTVKQLFIEYQRLQAHLNGVN